MISFVKVLNPCLPFLACAVRLELLNLADKSAFLFCVFDCSAGFALPLLERCSLSNSSPEDISSLLVKEDPLNELSLSSRGNELPPPPSRCRGISIASLVSDIGWRIYGPVGDPASLIILSAS